MSLFAKIMVVVNFVLAVCFLAAAGTYLGAMDDFKGRWTKEQASHETSRSELGDQIKAADSANDALKDEKATLETGKAAADSLVATLQNSNKTLEERITQLAAATTKLGDTYQTLQNANDRLQTEKQNLQNQVNTAASDARDSRAATATANQTIKQFEQQLADSETALAAQQVANGDQAEKIDRMATHIAMYQDRYGELGAVAQAKVDGAVQAVDNEMDIFVISVGSKDKVEVGYTFTVYRGNNYVSTIVVDEVFPNHASCHTKQGMKKSSVKAGDQISTRL